MLKVRIHGLAPTTKSKSHVIIYNRRADPSSGRLMLSEGSPDKNGLYACEIANKYKNNRSFILV